MLLSKLSEFDVDTLSVSNTKNATYLQSDEKAFELQTDWMTLGKYPLPAKRYVTDDAKSMNLTIPISKDRATGTMGSADDYYYKLMTAIDDNLSKLSTAQYKKYHSLISEKDGMYYLKFKIYLNTGLFDKEKNRISITSLFDFYKYLREDTQIKIVFGFSKLWSMWKEYGFSLLVKRIVLKNEVKEVLENKIEFLDN